MTRTSAYVYLASQSPRRQELLTQLGVAFEALLPSADEDIEELEIVQHRESAHHYVQRVTALKAGAAILRRRRRELPDAPILCADTTVSLGHCLMGKPADDRHALEMLTKLSGTTHRVLTAVAVVQGRTLRMATSVSRVTFRHVSQPEIKRYVATGEPYGKAGAYAIQGRAAAFVERISGSPSGIIGLPLCETFELLRASGVSIW